MIDDYTLRNAVIGMLHVDPQVQLAVDNSNFAQQFASRISGGEIHIDSAISDLRSAIQNIELTLENFVSHVHYMRRCGYLKEFVQYRLTGLAPDDPILAAPFSSLNRMVDILREYNVPIEHLLQEQ